MEIEKVYLREVAETILQQLYIKKTELWAWGAKNFFFLEREIDGIKCPALMFSIRTPKIERNGRVIISLDQEADQYIVEAIRISKGIEKEVGQKTGIFCDQLHNAINSLIEDKETYTKVFF